MDEVLLARIDERVEHIQKTVVKIDKSIVSNRTRITRLEIGFASVCGFLGINFFVL